MTSLRVLAIFLAVFTLVTLVTSQDPPTTDPPAATEVAGASTATTGGGGTVTDAPGPSVSDAAATVAPAPEPTQGPGPAPPASTAASSTNDGVPVTEDIIVPVTQKTLGGVQGTTAEAATSAGTVTDQALAATTGAAGTAVPTDAPATAGGTTRAPVTAGLAPTTVAANEPTTQVADPTNPCQSALVIKNDARHVTNSGGAVNDDNLVEKWYAFKYQNKWAEIPQVCIKHQHCGTYNTYYMDLKGQPLPDGGDNTTATLSGSATGPSGTNCGMSKQTILVHNCSDHFVYMLSATNKDGGICIIEAGEAVPYEVLGDPPVTTVATEAPSTTETQTEQTTIAEEITTSLAALATTMHTTTQASFTVTPLNLPLVDRKDMSKGQIDSIATIIYQYHKPRLDSSFKDFDCKFRTMIAEALNRLVPKWLMTTAAATTADPTTLAATPPTTTTTTQAPADTATRQVVIDPDKPGIDADPSKPVGPNLPDVDNTPDKGPGFKRRRAVNTDRCGNTTNTTLKQTYTADDVYYVRPTPRVGAYSQKLTLSIFVIEQMGKDSNRAKRDIPPDDTAVPVGRLLDGLDWANKTNDINIEPNTPLVTYYGGLPDDLKMPEPAKRTSIWEAHMGLWITIIILLIICIIVIIIGLICLRCCRNGKDHDKSPIAAEEGKKKPPPTVIENPIPDEEIIKGEAAPMVESANPAVTPNGGGQHLSKKDEDNGWVVPMDQLTPAERGQPDVENTKL